MSVSVSDYKVRQYLIFHKRSEVILIYAVPSAILYIGLIIIAFIGFSDTLYNIDCRYKLRTYVRKIRADASGNQLSIR